MSTSRDELELKVEERTRQLAQANIHFNLSTELFSITGFDGYFKRLNPIWERTTGYTMDELKATPAIEFIHPEDRESLLKYGERLLQGESLISMEARLLCKDGSFRWLLWSATADLEQGVVYGAAHDITARKAAEEKINLLNVDLEHRVENLAKVNQELESLTSQLEMLYDQALEASNVKSEFVANISHELRTPISAVIGMAELLLDGQLNDEQANFVKMIHESATSLLSIINDILDFSKMEAGKIQLENIAFDVRSLIESSIELVAAQAREKKLDLLTEVDPALPARLIGDPIRVKQILLNLLGNALKFTDRGKVVLRCRKIDDAETFIVAHFEVEDTGIGLSLEARSRLFQPFMQADGSTTRRFGGTGLGLSICRQLVQLMRGEIGVESEEGQGARFWFSIPLEKELPAGEGKALSVTARGTMQPGPLVTDKIVLVAEDNVVMQQLVTRQLRKLGVQCESVGNGLEAVRAVRSGRYAAVLMDCQMPGMDGYEATRRIRAQEAGSGRHTPVVALTASAMQGDRETCLAAGMDDYLAKPVTQQQLRSVLERWLLAAADPGAQDRESEAPKANCIDIDGLKATYGAGSCVEILELFLKETAELFSGLAGALQEKDRLTGQRLAHQLKGLAAVMLSRQLAEYGESLEKSLRGNDWTKAGALLNLASGELSEIEKRIGHFIEQQST